MHVVCLYHRSFLEFVGLISTKFLGNLWKWMKEDCLRFGCDIDHKVIDFDLLEDKKCYVMIFGYTDYVQILVHLELFKSLDVLFYFKILRHFGS